MRVSTSAMQQQSLNVILQQQASLARTQLQVATGKNLLSPADDPVGSQRALQIEQSIGKLDQYSTNGKLVAGRLIVEDSKLDAAAEVLQRVRELVIQASNATQTTESRNLIATEIRELNAELLDIGNSENGQGEYIFAGSKTDTRPFARNSTGVTYSGDQNQRELQIADQRRMTDGDTGSHVFLDIPDGNGTFSVEAPLSNTGTGAVENTALLDPRLYDNESYTIVFTTPTTYDVVPAGGGAPVAQGDYEDGDTLSFLGIEMRLSGEPETGDEFAVSPSTARDVFTTIDDIVAALGQPVQNDNLRAYSRSELNAGIYNLDQALGRVLEVRTDVGSRLDALESQEASNEELGIQLQSTLSDIVDVDYAEAISRLNLQLTGLDAAQRSFARLQDLSLFNYL